MTKIADIAAYPLRSKLRVPFAYSQRWFSHRSALLVKVTTDQGIVGWGEIFCHDGWPAVVSIIQEVFRPHLLGQEAAPAVIWDLLYNWTRDYGQKGLTTAALSGVDIALWDILGKEAGLPVYRLLGGPFRTRVQAYATGMYLTEPAVADPGVIAREAAGYVGQGFQAVKVKVGFGLERDKALIREVRAAVGDGVGVMMDANHAYDAATAISLGRAVEKHNIGWFEEPVVPEDVEGYRSVRQALSIPVAGGEAEFTRYGFRDLIGRGGVDIAQPDICICGGISEAAKIAALAQAWHVRCIPHVWGTGVALATALHFIAALPDQPPSLNPRSPMLEFDRTENPIRDEILASPLELTDGQVTVPPGPGLGITVDERVLQRYKA